MNDFCVIFPSSAFSCVYRSLYLVLTWICSVLQLKNRELRGQVTKLSKGVKKSVLDAINNSSSWSLSVLSWKKAIFWIPQIGSLHVFKFCPATVNTRQQNTHCLNVRSNSVTLWLYRCYGPFSCVNKNKTVVKNLIWRQDRHVFHRIHKRWVSENPYLWLKHYFLRSMLQQWVHGGTEYWQNYHALLIWSNDKFSKWIRYDERQSKC